MSCVFFSPSEEYCREIVLKYNKERKGKIKLYKASSNWKGGRNMWLIAHKFMTCSVNMLKMCTPHVHAKFSSYPRKG